MQYYREKNSKDLSTFGEKELWCHFLHHGFAEIRPFRLQTKTKSTEFGGSNGNSIDDIPTFISGQPAPVKKKAPRIKSLRKPKPLKRAPRKTRPSLSEQLANIGAGAASVTADLRKKHNLHPGEGEPLFTSPSLKFIVGRLESKLPSPVNFFHDHCGYIFNHPYQSKQIKMKMYYSDMQKAHVRESMGNYVFEFKIGHAMKQYGIDYDPGQHDHMVKIVLASQRDAKLFTALAQ